MTRMSGLMTTRTWKRAVALAAAGAFLFSPLAYGLAPASRFQKDAGGLRDAVDRRLSYKQANVREHYAKADRGWLELEALYSSKEENFLLKAIEALPKSRPAKVLLVGAGTGRVILDIARKFPKREFEFHSVNKEPDLLYDLEGIQTWLGKSGTPAEARRFFDLLHAHHHVLDLSEGRGVDSLDGDFDLIVAGNYALSYIPGHLALVQALYHRLRPWGKLFAVISNIRFDRKDLWEGREREAVWGEIELRLGLGWTAAIPALKSEGLSVRLTRNDKPLELPFSFVRYQGGWDVYAPSHPEIVRTLADSVGLDVLREVFRKDSFEFVKWTLEMIGRHEATFRMMVRLLGLPAIRQALGKHSWGFAMAVQAVEKHQALFHRLRQPTSLGRDVLRDLLAEDPGTFSDLIHVIADELKTFQKLCEPGHVGIEGVREALRRHPAGFMRALPIISGDRAFFDTFEKLAQAEFIGQADLQETFRKDPRGFASALGLIDRSPREASFFRGFLKLADSPIGLERLRGAFVQLPYPAAHACVLAGRMGEKILSYVRADGGIDLDRLLDEGGTTLVLETHEIASLNAAGGLAGLLKLGPGKAVIRYGGQVSEPLARERFPGYALSAQFSPRPRGLYVRFSDEVEARLEAGEWVAPRNPYQCALLRRVPDLERRRLREAMRLAEGRKVVVLASPDEMEARLVLQAYRELEPFRRPLLILGLRQPYEGLMKRNLIRRGFRAVDRDAPDGALSAFGQAEIVVLNTAGEILKLLAAADLAIVGHDRNIFEPASQGVPVLYFSGTWLNNTTAKRLLDESGGAAAVDLSRLAEQMAQILDRPQTMIEGTQRAVQAFNQEVVPAAKLVGSIIMAAGVLTQSHFAQALAAETRPAAPVEPEAVVSETGA